MSNELDFMVPLFVPGNRPERFERAASAGADAVIIDLEDAVPAGAKHDARSALRANFGAKPILVRVNAIGTPWHNADLASLPAEGLAGIVLPKAEVSHAFLELCATLPTPIIALIESARGLSQVRQIATTSNIARIAFGSIDFCADLSCAHSRQALISARAEIVLASRIGSLPAPIDGVTTAIDDETEILEDTRHACELGFGGKLCIHPRQIDAIRRGFAPSPAEIAWANEVVASGDGAAAIGGSMVDEPVRVRARSFLRRIGSAEN